MTDDEYYGGFILRCLAFVGVMLVVFLVVTLGSIVRGCWTSTDHMVDFCYIDDALPQHTSQVHTADNPMYELHGHVPYGNDSEIGIFQTFDQAVQAAQKIDCPLRARQQ